MAYSNLKHKARRRVDVTAILKDASLRRKLMVDTIIATQAREGITTTKKQAELAYDKVNETRRKPTRTHG